VAITANRNVGEPEKRQFMRLEHGMVFYRLIKGSGPIDEAKTAKQKTREKVKNKEELTIINEQLTINNEQ
jgi:hypothetical protein